MLLGISAAEGWAAGRLAGGCLTRPATPVPSRPLLWYSTSGTSRLARGRFITRPVAWQVAPGEPFPGRHEPTLIAYTCLVRRRFSPWRSPGRSARADGEDCFELLPSRQVVGAHGIAATDVGEGGLNPVDREAVHLRPGQPVDG